MFGIKLVPTYFSSDLYSVIAVWTFKCKKLIFCPVKGSLQIHEMHHHFFKFLNILHYCFFLEADNMGKKSDKFFHFCILLTLFKGLHSFGNFFILMLDKITTFIKKYCWSFHPNQLSSLVLFVFFSYIGIPARKGVDFCVHK